MSNIILLLQTLSRLYPQDQYFVVCAPTSDLNGLSMLPNVEVIHYGGSRHKEVDRLLLGYFGLKQLVEKYRIDVAWSLNIGPYIKLKVPHVLSINNAYQVYPLDEVAHFHPKSRFNLIFLRAFFQKSLRRSDAAILQTPLMKDYVQKIKGAPLSYVVPKAVERDEGTLLEMLPVEMLSQLESTPVGFTFLYVATCMPHKNYQLLFDVFDILMRRSIRARLVLTITPDELKGLDARAQALIDSGYIIPIGWVKKQHLRALYRAADACLMPSLLESLSSAHLEAMQWGKPQIAADLPFSRDLCGDAAVYVPVNNAEQWVTEILALMGDDQLRDSLVHKGYERMALYPKTWDDVVDQIHVVFEHLVVKM